MCPQDEDHAARVWNKHRSKVSGVPFSFCSIELQMPPTLIWAPLLGAPTSPSPGYSICQAPGEEADSYFSPAHQTSLGTGMGVPSYQGLEPCLGVAKDLVAKSIKTRDHLPGPALCGCQRIAVPLWRPGPVPSPSPGCLSDQSTGDQLMHCGRWSSKGLARGRWEPGKGREGQSWWLRSGVGGRGSSTNDM